MSGNLLTNVSEVQKLNDQKFKKMILFEHHLSVQGALNKHHLYKFGFMATHLYKSNCISTHQTPWHSASVCSTFRCDAVKGAAETVVPSIYDTQYV